MFPVSMVLKILWGSLEDMSWTLSERNPLKKTELVFRNHGIYSYNDY